MHEFIYSIPSFLVAITILVAIHEFGHYWVAKKLGVKIIRFSIGFGKPIYRKIFSDDKTEFVIAAIPLGGYVKMLDEREAEVDASELNRAFNRQPVAKRFAIVFAGPLFNFIFAVFAYWAMFVNGTPGIKPVIGSIIQDTPAQIAGLQVDDTIVSINNVDSPVWDVVITEFVPALINKEVTDVVVKRSSGAIVNLSFNFSRVKFDLEEDNILKVLGFKPWRPQLLAEIGTVLEGEPAEKAGLLAGDIILKIKGIAVKDWNDMAKEISKYPEQSIEFQIKRKSDVREFNVRVGSVKRDNKTVGRVGIGPVSFPDEMKTTYQYSAIQSVPKAIETTWLSTVRTVNFLYKMVVGEISLKNISGPITIAKYAGLAADAGFSKFMGLLAIISISLGVLNLLPVPMLDGGHLLYYVIEIVKGSPVSASAEMFGQQIGIVFLVMLMSLAFYNDLLRLFG